MLPGRELTAAHALQLMQEFTNLGPIVDFEVVDLDAIGQPQLVACCNSGRFGSLRLIRNGIGINEQAAIVLEGARDQLQLQSHPSCHGMNTLADYLLRSAHSIKEMVRLLCTVTVCKGWVCT